MGLGVGFRVGFGGGEWAGDAPGGEVLPARAEPTDQRGGEPEGPAEHGEAIPPDGDGEATGLGEEGAASRLEPAEGCAERLVAGDEHFGGAEQAGVDGEEEDAEGDEGESDEADLEEIILDGGEILEGGASAESEGEKPSDDEESGHERNLGEADGEEHPRGGPEWGIGDPAEGEGGEERAEENAPEADGRPALGAVRPEDPAVIGELDGGLEVGTFYGEANGFAEGLGEEGEGAFPSDGDLLFAWSDGDDDFGAFLAKGDGLAAVGEGGDFGVGREFEEKVFA